MTSVTDSVTPSMIGTVLGNYRIVDVLSTGGMGAVYRAEHELLGRSAAVKLLRPELTANAELVQRFFNEAKAATAIRHPGIIEVFDFGHADDGRAYLIMEFLDGDSLSKRLADRGRLSEREAAQIGRGIASALTAAHKQGITHRDLKPDNIFLVPDPDLPSGERPKILDFGIAKLADPVPSSARQTATGALMGTPLYMAPEQARAAAAIDHRADLYSLGCILYELLAGEPPFLAEGAGEIIALQLFGKPDPLSTRLATISPDMERIVMRLLEKEPVDRFQSAAEVNDALGATVATLSGGISAPLAASASRPQITLSARPTLDAPHTTIDPEPRRNLMPVIAGCVTLAIAGAIVAIILSRGGSRPASPPAASIQIVAPPIPDATIRHAESPDTNHEADPKPESMSAPHPAADVTHPTSHATKTPRPVVKLPTHPIADPKKARTDKGSPIEVNLDSNEP
ncbi:MAG: serine/threonine protein kinase [Myxococcales bacterium]|nr:serine/threonine protein kinase [Myxococcales bacterium]